MAKFVYRMENILQLKERLETQAKSEYAEMSARVVTEQNALRAIDERIAAYKAYAKECSQGTLNIIELKHTEEAIKITKDIRRQQELRVNIALRNEEIARQRLNTAMQERKVQEKLKEKAFEEFKADLNAQEIKEIDELVSFTYNDRSDES